MESFTLQAPCRLETTVSVWDTNSEKWKTQKRNKPRLIPNPPQRFTNDQAAFIKDYRGLLAESIRLESTIRRAQVEREKAGPIDFLYMHYKLLEAQGFGAYENDSAMKQMIALSWDLVDRYEWGRIDWETFENRVENWFLSLSDKLISLKAFTGAAI